MTGPTPRWTSTPRPRHPTSRDGASDHLRGLLITAGGVVALSPDALLIRLAEVGTWKVVFWRTALIALSVTAGLVVRHRRRLLVVLREAGRPLIWSSLLFGATSIGFVGSISNTQVAHTLVILATAPLFAALVTRFGTREGVPTRTWAAALVAAGGIGLQFAGALRGGRLLGDALAVATAALLATNLVVLREGRRGDMLPAAAVGSLLAAVVAAAVAWPVTVPPRSLGILAIMGGVQVPLALALIVTGTRYLPAPEVGLLMLLETVLGPLWAWMGVGEAPSTYAFVGGGVVVATLAAHSLLGLRASDDAPLPHHG